MVTDTTNKCPTRSTGTVTVSPADSLGAPLGPSFGGGGAGAGRGGGENAFPSDTPVQSDNWARLSVNTRRPGHLFVVSTIILASRSPFMVTDTTNKCPTRSTGTVTVSPADSLGAPLGPSFGGGGAGAGRGGGENAFPSDTPVQSDNWARLSVNTRRPDKSVHSNTLAETTLDPTQQTDRATANPPRIP